MDPSRSRSVSLFLFVHLVHVHKIGTQHHVDLQLQSAVHRSGCHVLVEVTYAERAELLLSLNNTLRTEWEVMNGPSTAECNFVIVRASGASFTKIS